MSCRSRFVPPGSPAVVGRPRRLPRGRLAGGLVAAGRHAGPARRLRRRPAGGGLERHPARALEVQLRPRVQLVQADDLLALHGVAEGEADRDPRRDPELARHHGHRRGEVHAVALPRLQEGEDRLRAVAVADRCVDGLVVGELVRVAQPGLQRQRLVVRGRLAGGHLAGLRPAPAGRGRAAAAGTCAATTGPARRGPQRLGVVGSRPAPSPCSEICRVELFSPNTLNVGGVVEPGAVDVGDLAGRVGQRQPGLGEVEDLDRVVALGAARSPRRDRAAAAARPRRRCRCATPRASSAATWRR